MNNYKRLLIFVLCFALLFIPLVSFLYIIGHSNHECTLAVCPICIHTEFAKNNLNNIKILYIASLYILMVVFAVTFIFPERDVIYHSGKTLISLKVELLN